MLAHRWLRVSEETHSTWVSQTNHNGATCGPSGPAVASRQVRCSARNESSSAGLIAITRLRRCCCTITPRLIPLRGCP